MSIYGVLDGLRDSLLPVVRSLEEATRRLHEALDTIDQELDEPQPEPNPTFLPAPTGLVAGTVPTNRVHLSWEDVDEVHFWRIYEERTAGVLETVSEATHTFRGPLAPGTYRYSIQAVSAGLESAIVPFPPVVVGSTSEPPPEPDESVEPEPDPEDDDWDFEEDVLRGYPLRGDVGWAHDVVESVTTGTLRSRFHGQVISHIDHTGPVVIEHDDVTIRQSWLRAAGSGIHVRVMPGTKRLRIEDCTLDGAGRANPAVAYTDYTLIRCELVNYAEGPRANGRVTITDCHMSRFVQVGSNHTDAIQSTGGKGIVVERNNIELHNPASPNPYMNAAFMGGNEEKPLEGLIIRGNRMTGGNYTINLGGGGSKPPRPSGIIEGNVLEGPRRYGALGNIPSGVQLRNNTIID